MIPRIRKKDFFSCIFFIFFWLIPLIFIGFSNKPFPGLPRSFYHLSKMFLLFENSARKWPIYYIQILHQNSQQWITLPEEEYFPLQFFGYRSRLQRFLVPVREYGMSDQEVQGINKDRQAELADWIAARYYRLHRDQSSLAAVRFVIAFYSIDPFPGERKLFLGHWKNPPLYLFAPEKIQILSTHTVK